MAVEAVIFDTAIWPLPRPGRAAGAIWVSSPSSRRRGSGSAGRRKAERIEWVPLTDAPALISGGQVKDASTAAALLWLQASMPRIEP
jgi:hypothetical protein